MNLEDLRGSYKGRIYLLGNGAEQKEKVKYPIFGMNRCGRTFDADFYLCIDRYVLDNYADEVHDSIKAAEVAFVPHDTTDTFDGVPVIVKRTPQTDDLTEGVYCYGSSMTAAVQLIDWMGFTKITIDRVDFYEGNQLHHYSDDSMALLSERELKRRKQKNLRAHAWIIDYCGFKGIELNYA
jgi:hypothetical protein